MGSSGSESVDFAVGSIVWVRRRNGSWWPGKILGPHDLSNNHLMSPRSGTPVKLLGREDASVDWYNLEKSKRVKAFRCGDFDECIERAESSIAMPPKKREKYARREDAILHALELEKQMLDSHARGVDIASDIKASKSSVSCEKGSVTSSGNEEPDELNGCNTQEHVSEGTCASPARRNGFHPLSKLKEAMLPEDEAPPKMRDLQEFGLQTIPSKRKFSSSIKADEIDGQNKRYQAYTTAGGFTNEGTSARGYYRCPPAAQVPQNSANLSSFRVGQADNHADSHHVSAPNMIKDAYWAKRNRCMYLPSESNGYSGKTSEVSPTIKQVSNFPRRDSKIPLRVSVSDDNGSEFSEDTESDTSDSDDSETDSDEMNAITGRGDEHSIEGSEAEGRLINMCNEELDEFALASEIPLSADDGVSKWKLKGKRNIRHIKKRSSHIPNAGVRMNEQTYLETRGNTFNNRASRYSINYQPSNDFDAYFEVDDSFDGNYRIPGSSHRNTRHSALRHMPRGRSTNNNIHNNIYDWDGMPSEHRTPLNGYLMETEEYYTGNQNYVSHGHFDSRRRNMLFEVDLKVQSSYPKQRVPIISLMSKVDGRAIIGHSLQIEEIAEGSSDALLSKRSEFYNGRVQEEVDYSLPSGWKTARRTANYRVPRPDLSSVVDNGGDAEYVPLGRKSTSRDFNTSIAMQKFDPSTIHHVPSLKPTRQLSKKASMSSSQKTRTLSSFSVDQHKQRTGKGRHDTEAFSISDLIKSESGSTNVPCIPVKLAFSRLYEAVGRPSASIAPLNHEARVNTMTTGVQHKSLV